MFSGTDLRELSGFVAYDPGFRGGVHVAAGDVDGDGRTDLITGAGPGGPPHVRVFSGADGRELASFAAFDTGTGGVSVGSIGEVAVPGFPSPALRFTSAPATTFAVGSAGTFIVTTSGSATAALTVAGALPSGVTFVDRGDGTGALSGTPAVGTAGTYDLTFTAIDGVDGPAVQPFTLTVSGASVFTSANAATFTTGSAGTFTVTASGTPPPALTAAGALPAGVTFVDHGNGTATLSGTPRAGTAGTYALTFTAANAIDAAAVQSFTFTVRAPTVVAHLAMGSGPGSSPAARVLSATVDRTVLPYTPAFLGGVSVALGDVNGDGTADLITGAGPGEARASASSAGRTCTSCTVSWLTTPDFPAACTSRRVTSMVIGAPTSLPAPGRAVARTFASSAARTSTTWPVSSRMVPRLPAPCTCQPATSMAMGASTSSPGPDRAAARA